MAEPTSPQADMPDNPPDNINWVSFILAEIRDLRQEMRGLQGRVERLEERMETRFRWTVGIVMVTWLTVIGLFFPPVLQLQADVGALKVQVATMQEQIIALQETDRAILAQLASMQETDRAIQAELAAMQETDREILAELASMQGRITSLEEGQAEILRRVSASR